LAQIPQGTKPPGSDDAAIMTNRIVTALSSVAFASILIASTLVPQAYAMEIAGANPVALPDPAIAQDQDIMIIENLKIVSDDQLQKTIPLSMFYQLPVEKVAFKGVSQHFGPFHPAIDLRAELLSNVKPMLPGVVTTVAVEPGGYGNYVIIDHKNGMLTLYAHLAKVLVKEGEEVGMTDAIGKIGVTGHSTGPHLHFEIRTSDGSYINPEKIFADLPYTPAPNLAAAREVSSTAL
jgi:murein DD-endopeptidase MepM/ murein hydrolase activator NlpD